MARYDSGNYYNELLLARTAIDVTSLLFTWKIAPAYLATHRLDEGLSFIYTDNLSLLILALYLEENSSFFRSHDLQDIDEFKKLLKYFNDGLGPAVCIYTIVNLSWAIAGIVWLFQYYINDTNDIYPITYVNVVNIILWILISIAPFIQVGYILHPLYMLLHYHSS